MLVNLLSGWQLRWAPSFAVLSVVAGLGAWRALLDNSLLSGRQVFLGMARCAPPPVWCGTWPRPVSWRTRANGSRPVGHAWVADPCRVGTPFPVSRGGRSLAGAAILACLVGAAAFSWVVSSSGGWRALGSRVVRAHVSRGVRCLYGRWVFYPVPAARPRCVTVYPQAAV